MSAVSRSSRVTAVFFLFSLRRVLVPALLMFAAPCGVAANLSLNEAELLAVADEPGAAGLAERARSLRDSALAAAELPDPKLRVGLMNYPLESGGFGTEGMTQVLVGLHQPLPDAAARTARADMTDAQADDMSHRAELRRRDALRDTRLAWLDSHRWQQARGLVERSRTAFTDLVRITEATYAVGRRSQHDLLQAELELTRLDDRLAQMAGAEAVVRAGLARWVGTDNASRPVDAALPEWPAPLPPDDLRPMLLAHPLLASADAAIAGESAAVRLAEAAYRPDWGVDVSYGYRDGRLPNGSSRSDFFSVMVTLDMPLFGHRRQDRQLAASQGGKRAAIDQHSALVHQLAADLAAAHARYASLTERIAYYDASIAPRSLARIEAAMAAYQSGAGDFNDLVRSYVAQLDIELQRLNLDVDRALVRATIAWLTEDSI